jgi:hypothetical protein
LLINLTLTVAHTLFFFLVLSSSHFYVRQKIILPRGVVAVINWGDKTSVILLADGDPVLTSVFAFFHIIISSHTNLPVVSADLTSWTHVPHSHLVLSDLISAGFDTGGKRFLGGVSLADSTLGELLITSECA